VLFDMALCISDKTFCWLIVYCARLTIEGNRCKNLDILVSILLHNRFTVPCL